MQAIIIIGISRMSEAARVGDPIAHTSALSGLLTGLAIGAAVAVAGAAIAGTGGLAAVAAVGAGIGELIGSLSCCTHNTGQIIEGSANVFINGRPAVCASLSSIACDKHSIQLVAQGSSTVYINGMPAARVGDSSTCDGKISAGSSNVFIGGQTLQTEDISPEVPLWLNLAVMGLGLGSAVALKVGWRVIMLGLAGSFGVGKGGHWLGGKWFGEDSDGQKVMGFGGAVLGGLLGGHRGIPKAARTLKQDINYRANKKIAYDFFTSKGVGKNQAKIYMKGFDFNKPVSVEMISSGTKLWQYQVEGGAKGRWFSPVKEVEPTALGINPKGRHPKTGIVTDKVIKEYQATQRVEVLRGTAARVKDDWSIPKPAKPYQTEGGAQQLFIPSNSTIIP